MKCDGFPSHQCYERSGEKQSSFQITAHTISHGEYLISLCLQQVNKAVAAVKHITVL